MALRVEDRHAKLGHRLLGGIVALTGGTARAQAAQLLDYKTRLIRKRAPARQLREHAQSVVGHILVDEWFLPG
jgi:hypothetical protein